MSSPAEDAEDGISVDTQDAVNVLARIDFIVASLEKAGVPAEELQHFKSVVHQVQSRAYNFVSSTHGSDQDNAGVVAEGALEKLQKGTQGFAPVWKLRWVRLLPGELQVFESRGRPEPGTNYLFSLPLSVQQTRMDPGNEALCKRLGRETILVVGSRSSVGGTVRSVTLAVKDDLALEQWTGFLEKATSQDGHMDGASIFRASQTGDIVRVKELVARGIPVNRANAYGCVSLHYAVKNAADCATMVARGSDDPEADGSKIRAQEALRVVVFLMSHGADSRVVNNLGETPLDVASRLTSGFPKSRSLLISILDSSKYQVSGGTIFIVPGAPRLMDVKEEGEDDDDDGQLDPQRGTVRARGVTFSPSRRNRRARREEDLAKTRLPYTPAAIAPSFGEGSRKIPTLPCGDHETTLGGARHRLAAGFDSRRRRDRETPQSASPSRGVAPAGRGGRASRGIEAGAIRSQETGVMFEDFRLGRKSAVHIGGFKRRRGRPGVRPSSCPVGIDNGRARSVCSRTCQPDISDRRGVNRRQADDGRPMLRGNRSTDNGAKTNGRQQQQRSSKGKRRRRHREEVPRLKAPSVPDSEARRRIAEWLRESAGTASAVPPVAAHGTGKYLGESSSFVATEPRSDVYRALQTIKGDGRGELISAQKLRATLCRVGQPLLPHEMDELLREADPGETGYISCSRLSRLVAGGRLAPLAEGTLYNEEDDTVLKAKIRRLARLDRLKRTAAIAGAAQAAA